MSCVVCTVKTVLYAVHSLYIDRPCVCILLLCSRGCGGESSERHDDACQENQIRAAAILAHRLHTGGWVDKWGSRLIGRFVDR